MTDSPTALDAPHHHQRRRQVVRAAIVMASLWLLAAYLLLPVIWDIYFRWHPKLDDLPGITTTTVGIPGDPINVGLVGTEAQIAQIMTSAGWRRADSLGLASDARIAADTVLDRPYEAAPVSSLYLYGRREDLAFEKPVGGSPQHRNHVRFWKSPQLHDDGRPLWLGSASYDMSVGLSHTTGEITHHIAPDLDTERDRLFADLKSTGDISDFQIELGFHKVLSGKNGGGDPWHTDGNLWVGVIRPTN